MKLVLLVFCSLLSISTAQFGLPGQNGILNVHNTMRRSIAKGIYVAKGTKKPAGSNIRQMIWDPTIAKSAQNYAQTCPDGHSHAAGVGENLYWYWSSGPLGDLDRYGAMASASWEKEFQDYGWKSNTFDHNLFNSGVGHATQMAWADTYLIGCGIKACRTQSPKSCSNSTMYTPCSKCDAKSNGMNKITVVCQYKPPGNILTRKIYETGVACSACRTGSKCNDGLCV